MLFNISVINKPLVTSATVHISLFTAGPSSIKHAFIWPWCKMVLNFDESCFEKLGISNKKEHFPTILDRCSFLNECIQPQYITTAELGYLLQPYSRPSISQQIDLFHIINELCCRSTCQAWPARVNNERKLDVSGSSLSDSVALTIQYIRTNVSCL